jgi:hypothetical protein
LFARLIRVSIQLCPCGGCDTKTRLSCHCKTKQEAMTMCSLFRRVWGQSIVSFNPLKFLALHTTLGFYMSLASLSYINCSVSFSFAWGRGIQTKVQYKVLDCGERQTRASQCQPKDDLTFNPMSQCLWDDVYRPMSLLWSSFFCFS